MHRHPVQSLIFQIDFCQRTAMTYKYDILKHFQEKNRHYVCISCFRKTGQKWHFYLRELLQNSTIGKLTKFFIHVLWFLTLSQKKEHPPVFMKIYFLWQSTKWTFNIWSQKRKSKLNFSQFYCSFFYGFINYCSSGTLNPCLIWTRLTLSIGEFFTATFSHTNRYVLQNCHFNRLARR